MKFTRRRTLTSGMATALATVVSGMARAEGWPTKPLSIVVPYAAGSATDTLARLMAEQLTPRLGQSVIVENRGGGNGTIAGGLVARAAPDGYTIMIGTATLAGNPNLMKVLPYDTLKDFEPVGFYGFLQFVLLVRADSGISTVEEFIKRAKEAKTPLTSGAGTPSARVITATMAERMKAPLTYVPYKAAPQALNDLLAGQIDLTFADVSIAAPQVKAGKVKALVLASESSATVLPGVPTFKQAGLGPFALDAWFVFMVPAKTPKDIRDKIDKAVGEVVVDPKMVARLHQMSFEPRYLPTAEVKPFIASEIDKWGRLAKAAGIEKE
jgi:tripartite-type tricarboxylate transporter receptor subunit TctC